MHASARPRESILNLFDPLISSRSVLSIGSDKENLHSSFDDDCLVDRELFICTGKPASPVVPKRRLVDVGDITVDESFDFSTPERQGKPVYDNVINTAIRIKPTQPESAKSTNADSRTPLQELVINYNLTPLAQTIKYKQQQKFSPSSSQSPTSELSNDAKIVCVSNPIGTTGTDPAILLHSYPLQQESPEFSSEVEIPDGEPPQIHFIINEQPASPATSNDAPTRYALCHSTPSSPSSGTHRLRPNVLQASSDCNRHSIDLHSSFQWHLQSEDASFDLLNDKISLFVSTSDTGLVDGDDDFEMAFDEAKEQRVSPKNVDQAQVEDVQSDTNHAAIPQIHSSRAAFFKNATTDVLSAQDKPQTFPVAQDTHRTKLIPSVDPMILYPSSHPSSEKIVSSHTAVQTPALLSRMIKPPPLVPALRIVKRAQQPRSDAHEKPAAVSVTSASQSKLGQVVPLNSENSRNSSNVIVQKPVTSMSQTSVRPRHMMATEGSGNTFPGKANDGPRRILTENSQNMFPAKSSDGPKRVLLTESRQSELKKEKILPLANTTGPRRVVVAAKNDVPTSTASVQVHQKAPALRLRKNLAPQAESNNSSSATLPRPITRLPMPSMSGLPRPAAGAGKGISRQRDKTGVVLPRRGVY